MPIYFLPKMPMRILSPLHICGRSHIRIAEMIGSYDLSNTQVPDSCTVFAPSSPATATPESLAEAEERKIPDYPAVLEKIIADIETIA